MGKKEKTFREIHFMVYLTIIPRGRVGYEMVTLANEARSAELAIIIRADKGRAVKRAHPSKKV